MSALDAQVCIEMFRIFYTIVTIFNTCFADIDECATDSSVCDQLCENTIGSFLCSCRDGYTLNPINNFTCDGNE